MLYPGPNGPSLVSEEFNELCVLNQVEVAVKPLPNPGSPYQAVRMLEIRSFSDSVVCITQNDSNRTTHYIPARGSIQMILKSDEQLPNIEKVSDATD
jgi:hypothetical protein